MPRSTYQLGLGFVGKFAVLLILGFLLLPVAVVTIAAFNDRAILSFPPQAWSLRWFAKAIAYQDFRDAFRNGLIVTAWSSTIALLVGAMFAFALDRYRFRFSKLIEAICCRRSSFRISRSGSASSSSPRRSAGAAVSRWWYSATSCWCCPS